MSTDGQRTLWRRNIAENFNRLSRAHERHRRQTDDRRQTTDGRTTTYSELELEFTFANDAVFLPHMVQFTGIIDFLPHMHMRCTPSNCRPIKTAFNSQLHFLLYNKNEGTFHSRCRRKTTLYVVVMGRCHLFNKKLSYRTHRSLVCSHNLLRRSRSFKITDFGTN